MSDKFEKLGLLIDQLDNLSHALNFPLPAQMHVDQFKSLLPITVKELKGVFVEISGENPWE